MTTAALLHLLARRAKRNRGAAGSQPVNVSGSEAAAGAPEVDYRFDRGSTTLDDGPRFPPPACIL
jgi:hypothetical protein